MRTAKTESRSKYFPRSIFAPEKFARRPPSDRVIEESARPIPVHTECDVLVVGGGPAGTAAAVAAAKMGADVIVLERYNHLGGLSTGGLVIWIDRMSDWQGNLVIRGFGEELLGRLSEGQISGPGQDIWGSKDPELVAYWGPRSSAHSGVVTYAPMIDPEWLKAESLAAIREAGVSPLFHCWGARPIMDDRRVAGCIFESKEGRRAIVAKVIIDATGDGDLFAQAGSGFDSEADPQDIHGCMNTAWLFGGVDMKKFLQFRINEPEQFTEFMARGREKVQFFERPGFPWREDIAVFMGPRLSGYSPLKIEDLTEVEIRSHQLKLQHLEFYKENAPGFSNAFLMLTGSQIGVRHARRLDGLAKLTRANWDGEIADDEIGVSPSLAPKFPNVSVPYRSIVPQRIEGLLAPGRHMSCDTTTHSFMREIPQCWLTGHGAGVAAAIAANHDLALADVPIKQLQGELVKQGAYIRERTPVAEPA